MTARSLGHLLLHDWADLRGNVALWVMLALPVLLSVFIVRLGAASGASASQTVPMWVLFAQVMIGIMTLVLNYVDEKEKGTLEALALTTVGHREVAVSKMLFVLVLSIVGQLVVLFVNGAYVGDVRALLGLAVLGGAVFVGAGMVIGAFVETERTAGAVGSAAMVLLFLTGVVHDAAGDFEAVLRVLPSVMSMRLVEGAMGMETLQMLDVLGLFAWLLVLLGVAQWKLTRDMRR